MKVKFLEAREVLDGEGIVIQKFRAGQVVELSTASARHWINRGFAIDVQAAAADPRMLPRKEDLAHTVADKAAKGSTEPTGEKADATDGTVNPTSPKRGRGRPPSASRPARA